MLIGNLSFSSFCLFDLGTILCKSERIFFDLLSPIFLIIILLNGLYDFLQFFRWVLIHCVEYGPGESLSMTNNIVPFLLEWSLLYHRLCIIIPVDLISIDSKLHHQSFIFLLLILNCVILLSVLRHFLLSFIFYLSLSLYLWFRVFHVFVNFLVLLFDGIKNIDSFVTFSWRTLTFALIFSLYCLKCISHHTTSLYVEEKD